MADKSKIEWCDATWNPTVGCSIVSPGCTNCYAMQVAHGLERRFDSPKYRGLTNVVNGNAVWTGEVRLDEAALLQPLKWKSPRRIFVNSMSDLFHESLPDEAIDKVFAVMTCAGNHAFQVLTKRAERMRGYVSKLTRERIQKQAYAISRCVQFEGRWLFDLPLPNVWLGVSCERQQEADERIPLLLQTPAAVRFVSAEPLLGLIDLMLRPVSGGDWDALRGREFYSGASVYSDSATALKSTHAKLDWVIVGGESGKGARPMHPQWARNIRDQCQAAGVAFFFKQHGEWSAQPDSPNMIIGANGSVWHPLYNTAALPNSPDAGRTIVARVGKKAAGRLLDGRTWDEFPERACPRREGWCANG